MKLAQAKARLIAIETSIEQLRASIARREQRGRAGTKAHAADLASLDRALVRAAAAKDRVGRAQIAESKAKRAEAFTASMTRQLDRIAAAAPKVDKRWRREREQEGKRIKKRKAELVERTTRDYGGNGEPAPDHRRPPVALPPPIQQPIAEEVSATAAPAPREGLIPGTWQTMPAGLAPLLDREPLPARWTWQHVGQRLLDAYTTLRSLPERERPRGFGAMWPAYKVEAGEAAIQAGTGTLAMERNRVRRTVSATEVALMEEAIGWIYQFCAHFRASDRQWLIFWCDDPDSRIDDGRAPKEYFEFIAKALNAAAEVVR